MTNPVPSSAPRAEAGADMNAVSTVLLDIDGTLLDSNDAHTQAWQRALARFGHDIAYDTLRPLIGKGGDKMFAEVLGIDEESAVGKQISAERKRLFSEEFLPTLRPTRGARALLERFLGDGYRLVVATSAGGGELTGLLKQAGVDDLISLTASSSDAKESKPDPDIIQAALRKAGVNAATAVLLGDTPHDIAAARRAGVRTVALRCGGWWSDEALVDAAALYDDPHDLLQHLATSPFVGRSALK
jgi:HAD superfamily hydrolase (TIGR01509 family)